MKLNPLAGFEEISHLHRNSGTNGTRADFQTREAILEQEPRTVLGWEHFPRIPSLLTITDYIRSNPSQNAPRHTRRDSHTFLGKSSNPSLVFVSLSSRMIGVCQVGTLRMPGSILKSPRNARSRRQIALVRTLALIISWERVSHHITALNNVSFMYAIHGSFRPRHWPIHRLYSTEKLMISGQFIRVERSYVKVF